MMTKHPTQILIPPHDLDAEKSVLGAILIDENAIIKVVESLKPQHFYKSAHTSIYECAINLYERREPIDLITLPQELKNKKLLTEIGGTSYLTELVNFVPTASNVEAYAKIIVDTALRRSLISASAKINEMAFEKSEIEGLLDEAEQELYAVSQDRLHQDFVPISETLQITFERLDEMSKTKGALRGVPTGIKAVDRMLSGFQKENLIILAARPSVGKSSFAINCAQYAATTHNKAVGLFSLEMGREQVVDRMISAQGDIDNWRITTGNLQEEDFERYGIAAGELAEASIYIDDTPGIGILELRTKARRLQMDKKIDLIIVDYLQLIHGRYTESRTQEVSEISQALKNLARELKIPVLALSQLSRAVEIRGGDKRPQLSDLRDSGCLLGNTLITLADSGKRVAIKDLVGKKDFNILAVSDDFKLKPSKVSKVFSNGQKLVYQLTTASGKQISASANHPFLTLAGWERLDKLKMGDTIGTRSDTTTCSESGSDIYWDKIKSIQEVGMRDVYDMTVPDYSNFVADDIIVHNSIEQDADVVMFLFRPNEEDRINHKLLIAKHRNGPTGEIDLFFKADRTRFFEAETKIKDK